MYKMSPMEVFRETMEGDTAMRDKIRESILCYSVSLGVRNSGTVCLAISGAEIVFTSKYTHHGPSRDLFFILWQNRSR